MLSGLSVLAAYILVVIKIYETELDFISIN